MEDKRDTPRAQNSPDERYECSSSTMEYVYGVISWASEQKAETRNCEKKKTRAQASIFQ